MSVIGSPNVPYSFIYTKRQLTATLMATLSEPR